MNSPEPVVRRTSTPLSLMTTVAPASPPIHEASYGTAMESATSGSARVSRCSVVVAAVAVSVDSAAMAKMAIRCVIFIEFLRGN